MFENYIFFKTENKNAFLLNNFAIFLINWVSNHTKLSINEGAYWYDYNENVVIM